MKAIALAAGLVAGLQTNPAHAVELGTHEEMRTALRLVRDQGFRCQQVIKLEKRRKGRLWTAYCYAVVYDAKKTTWVYPFFVTDNGYDFRRWSKFWLLPARCQKTPDEPCLAP